MPINKNAQIRYNTLDRCFRNTGRKYFIEDLIDECNKSLFNIDENTSGIQRRQIFDDIKFMESEDGYGIELLKQREGRKTYYRYENTKFSIGNQPINEKEANQLRSALMVLSRFEGLPQFEWVREMKAKLEHTFQLKDIEKEFMSFDSNVDLKGLEFLSILFDAIYYQKVVKVEYKSFFGDEIKTFEISPYFLKQYNNRWFLLGKDDRYPTITNIALDRIIKLDVLNNIYIQNAFVDFTDYFEDIIGVTRNNQASEIITFFVDKVRADYVKTKPIHGTQKKIEENEEGTTFSIDVIPNNELETQLFAFGDHLTVLSPVSVRNAMKERVIKLLSSYQ
ncbi:helix-turn-helix transcriptional regulator [Flammeovirga kamogawensis]|uniref:WYL domain-containing protein n=1 Tax=Flammeovirga kamogawensis TaxID=373891 RepID=A0ABX8H2X1_9BACT|nr:WYL domain-containing protein [Flammeovirga kamogawensis]MBB6460197.1 putative DNA-binding transcriptional regulator YafY [Flammeovirga kamogawensis]QWG10009.1 WYL domain-containing protein [Flammeovirga kamogawensis]TRX65517.1 WYL domain-containing protein [Flammeovirga kamogawensis]